MDEAAALRGMWEFPAAWKLLKLLAQPLSFAAPTATLLEAALLSPSDHVDVLANFHGRLLGLSVGNTSAKKWMQTTARFVRQRPEEFTFLAEDIPPPFDPKDEHAVVNAKEEPHPQAASEVAKEEPVQLLDPITNPQPFPTDERDYFRLLPVTRLLVLYTIAEIVLSEHDSLLCTGSLADIGLDDLRVFPFASDAAGNNYWYFGDFVRIYREPGRKVLKTRREKADDDAKAVRNAAEKAQQEAAAMAARLAREEKRREAMKKQEEVQRRREEREKRRQAKWAPRVAAQRTTRASRKAADALISGQAHSAAQDDVQSRLNGDTMAAASRSRRRTKAADQNIAAQEDDDDEDDKYVAVESGKGQYLSKRRKRQSEPEPPTRSNRTPKRPRRAEPFADPTLRKCEAWEVFSQGGDNLKQLIERFRPNDDILSSEKALVRRLEEEILPSILESEEKARKELERLERKRRNELLLLTFQKRSSRVQALAEKRAEEAKQAAIEEEKEKERLQRLAQHEEIVKSQIAHLEKEQSREIRIARRAHGRTEAIERDELLHRTEDKKSRRKEAHPEGLPTRRSTRGHRASRRSMTDLADEDANPNPKMPEQSQSPASEGSAVETAPSKTDEAGQRDVMGTEAGSSDANGHSLPTEGDAASDPDHTTKDPDAADGLLGADKVVQEESDPDGFNLTSSRTLPSTVPESAVTNSHTWLTNQDDGQPIRVLDKFFFVSQTGFEDAQLETCELPDAHVVGFGILHPLPSSASDAIRVEIPRVAEWVVEYGAEPKIWARSEDAWYELREPAIEYSDAFKSAKRKFEICVRIAILGSTMRTADLTYATIVELLSYRYEEMQSYSEEDLLQEKRFIASQMAALNKRSIVTSGFMKELHKKIRAEDSKAASEKRKAMAKAAAQRAAAEASVRPSPQESTKTVTKKAQANGVHGASAPRRQIRRRVSANGQPVVPRVVSVIITSLLRTATKSAAAKKRKRKHDPPQDRPVAPGSAPSPENREHPRPVTPGNAPSSSIGEHPNGTLTLEEGASPLVGKPSSNGYGTGEHTHLANGARSPQAATAVQQATAPLHKESKKNIATLPNGIPSVWGSAIVTGTAPGQAATAVPRLGIPLNYPQNSASPSHALLAESTSLEDGEESLKVDQGNDSADVQMSDAEVPESSHLESAPPSLPVVTQQLDKMVDVTGSSLAHVPNGTSEHHVQDTLS